MDKDVELSIYVLLFTLSLLVLLFASYHMADIGDRIIVYGIMLITGLTLYRTMKVWDWVIRHNGD